MRKPDGPARMVTITSPQDLASYIEHTLLRAEATTADITKVCEEARQFAFKAVCVNPAFVRQVSRALLGTSTLAVTVVGFPLGATDSRVKARETEIALIDGAQEIDMVLRLGALKEGDYSLAETDISEVVSAASGAPVKVIIETGLLSADEITTACKICETAGASFVKTATGFLGRGAAVEDIVLMRKTLSAHMKIKASGGIKSFTQAKLLIEAGADRIGASSSVALVQGQGASGGY